MAAHLAALEIFEEAGMDKIGEKRDLITSYLEFVIDSISEKHKDKCSFELITPRDKKQRGSQLSIKVMGQGIELFKRICALGVLADWREPNVIRLSPVPLYTSYEECFHFGQALEIGISTSS
jgi:kynureninase